MPTAQEIMDRDGRWLDFIDTNQSDSLPSLFSTPDQKQVFSLNKMV